MDYINEIKRITKENGGIIDNKRAASVGISRAMLSKLCKENKIQRLMRGQYILADDMQDELLSIELRPTQLIFHMKQRCSFMEFPIECHLCIL